MNTEWVRSIVTLPLYFIALVLQVKAVVMYPRIVRFERATYNFIVGAYVIHGIVFYGSLLIKNLSGMPNIDYEVWSNVLRIHVIVSIMVKEYLHIQRYKVEMEAIRGG